MQIKDQLLNYPFTKCLTNRSMEVQQQSERTIVPFFYRYHQNYVDMTEGIFKLKAALTQVEKDRVDLCSLRWYQSQKWNLAASL